MPIGALAVRVADLLKIRRGAPIYYDNGHGLQTATIDAIVPGKSVDTFEVLMQDPQNPHMVQVVSVVAKDGLVDKLSLHPQTLANGLSGVWKKIKGGMAANKAARLALKYLTEGFVPGRRTAEGPVPEIIPHSTPA